MRNGKGTWYQEAGWQYIGNWNDNKMTGEGILYQPDGKVRQKGNFNNGKCLNASDCKEFN
jgi:antitoxin component YwqK of YwqJK toxin-antitoxin module